MQSVERQGSPESTGLAESAARGAVESSPSELSRFLDEEDDHPDFGPFEPRLELEDGSPESPGLGLCESRLELEEQGSPELSMLGKHIRGRVHHFRASP